MITLNADDLQIYFGEPWVLNDNITIYQPKLNDIIKYGESKYFNMVHLLTAIPSDLKSQLWDKGIDWNELEDFELFMMLAPSLSADDTRILFGDLDFSKLRPYTTKVNDDVVLADVESGVIIDKLIYIRMFNYLCKLHNIKPKIEHAANKLTKRVLIDEDRMKIRQAQDKPFKSYLLPLITSVKVKQQYTLDYVRQMGLSEFFTEVARLQVIDQADHLLNGAYSGMIDTSKINKKHFDWMRSLDD